MTVNADLRRLAELHRRAEGLAAELANRDVDRAELRRIARYLGRKRELRSVEDLLACPPPRAAGRGEEHWENLRELVAAEAAWCLAAAQRLTNTPERETGQRLTNTPELEAAAQLEYILGWAGRLQQFYQSKKRSEAGAGAGRHGN
jgi:hypothetical protein